MMNDHFRKALEELDVTLARKIWAHVFPNMPQPKSDKDALVIMHHARTQMGNIALKLRAYSHKWLLDHGYPSGLPDVLKPSAERMYPRVVEGVGIAVKSISGNGERVNLVRGAMEDAVLEAFADGKTDPAFVKQRMLEARAKVKA